MRLLFVLSVLIFGTVSPPKSYAVEALKAQEPIRFLDYSYWRIMNPGDSCNYTPECDEHENCMEDNACAPFACDDTHKCVVGEKCDSGFCHI